VAAVGGCSDDPDARYELALDWQFLDGRSCSDAGVTQILVSDAGSLAVRAALSSCEAGRVGAPGARPQSIGGVPGGERDYAVVAESASGGALYRGAVTADAARASVARVLLRFTGG
jgi:hypothetical protein